MDTHAATMQTARVPAELERCPAVGTDEPARLLELAFEACFRERYRTRLVGGGDEPLYRPATEAHALHTIVYRHDYEASALHEVAHWCIAGSRRRKLLDYGYWYAPDGRSPAQQAEFELVEVKPQAMESLFAEAWGIRFELSADNLDGDAGPSPRFRSAVEAQRAAYRSAGLPTRAAAFCEALRQWSPHWLGDRSSLPG